MNGLGVLERMGEMARSGETFALATVVWRQGPSSSKQGSRAIITAAGELDGWIGGACAEPVVIREAKQVIADGEARLILLGTPDQFGAAVPEGMTVVPISCQSEGALEVYIEPVFPVPHLVIVGRSPMAHTLRELARALGWSTELLSAQDFALDSASNHGASNHGASNHGASNHGASNHGAVERSMVVVATQGHGDEDAIERAAAMRPAYLGLVASRKRAEAVLGYLAERGVPKDQLDRVHAPAGLDLGRTSHEEMAVAILAELVQLRAAGAIGDLPVPRQERKEHQAAGHHGAGHKPGGSTGPKLLQLAEALDPVCGMTVMADASAMPVKHDGTTYYFCCAGCRRSFEEDPDAYIKAVVR
jgi:xanthine dehydrogenase accessory factor